jgi:hypothetical protein
LIRSSISGVDNQIVPFALSSGERVDITSAGKERERRGDGPREITIGSA